MTANAQNRATKITDASQGIRDVAEKSTAQTKENLQQMSAAAVEASNLLKTSRVLRTTAPRSSNSLMRISTLLSSRPGNYRA
jgi:hypothetical protein